MQPAGPLRKPRRSSIASAMMMLCCTPTCNRHETPYSPDDCRLDPCPASKLSPRFAAVIIRIRERPDHGVTRAYNRSVNTRSTRSIRTTGFHVLCGHTLFRILPPFSSPIELHQIAFVITSIQSTYLLLFLSSSGKQ